MAARHSRARGRGSATRPTLNPSNPSPIGAGANGSAAFPGAWARQRDATNITVCIVDTGLDVTHPDLAPNLWVNSGEIPGNGIDDDRNGVVDDVNGFNGVDGSGNITVCARLHAVSSTPCCQCCKTSECRYGIADILHTCSPGL